MLEMIYFIKSLVVPSEFSKKKRAAEDYDLKSEIAKMRRTGTSPFASKEDHEPCASSLSTIKHRNSLQKYDSIHIWSKDSPIVFIEKEDVPQLSKPKYDKLSPNKSFCINGKTHLTSTPRTSFTRNGNSNDDVIFVGTTLGSDQLQSTARKESVKYGKPFSYLDDIHKKSTFQTGAKMKDFSIPIVNTVSETRTKLGLNKRYQHSTALDQSYRLDEKQKYQELLEQATTNSKAINSFSKYSTPINGYLDIILSKNIKKPKTVRNKFELPLLIDLTRNENYTATRKETLSTNHIIEKVLKEIEQTAVVAKQTSVEFEIPPSPELDFKVPRADSFKELVRCTKYADAGWLQDTILKHRKVVTNFEDEITTRTAHRRKLKEATSGIHTTRLENNLKRILSIRDAVLPVSFAEATSLPQISEEDDCRIDDALNKRASLNEILSSKFNLNISRRDMMTLAGLNWLNDEVINFYMNLIIERGKISKFPKTHAMNTFFYPKLLKDGHDSLKRWTRRIDVFSFDLIAVPIHLGVHWCMSVIDFRDRKIKYFDSMGSSNKQCLEALRSYLENEHMDKKKSCYDTSQWTLENVKNTPQQMNGSDCGMFACTIAEVLTRDAKIQFSQDDMPYLRRKMVLEILNGELMIQ